MPYFRLLKNPATYTPCSRENMLVDHEFRNYWLRHFESHFDTIAKLALFEYGPERKADIDACRDDFIEQLHRIREKPDLYGELNLLVLDMIRQQKLHAYDLHDPFFKTKQRENVAMRALYVNLISELDSTGDDAKLLLLLVEGLFAGNIFDLGASATSARFATESPDFISVRDSL